MVSPAYKCIPQPCSEQFVGDVLSLSRALMLEKTARQVIDRAVAFYESVSPLPDASQLASGLFTTIALEKEGGAVPLTPILDALKRGEGHSYKVRLLMASEAYVESTQYLFPMIFGFVNEAVRLCLSDNRSRRPLLFLRDGLIFWPAFLAAETPVDFLLYSRLHADRKTVPHLYRPNSNCIEKLPVAQMWRAPQVIDVGLYGTLVGKLLDTEVSRELGAFFFASRSPFISGWLNTLFVSSSRAFDSTDIIRLADTMESLLKPFQIIETEKGLQIVPSDILSFCSSVLCLWSLYQFRLNGPSCDDGLTFQSIENAKKKPSWFVKHPVPKWAGADQFLRSWRHGSLYPVGKLEVGQR